MAVEKELSLNEFLTRILDKKIFLKAANRFLGQLRYQQVVKRLVNGGLRQTMLIDVMTRDSES